MTEVSDAVKSVHDQSYYHIESKGEAGPLTEADLLADGLLKKGLMELCPQCAWISEESPEDKTRLTHDTAWIVDPIDGTKEFIARNGEYSVSVGLSVNGKAVLGAVAIPHSGRIIIGGSLLSGVWDLNKKTSKFFKTHHRTTQLRGSGVMVSRSEWNKKVFEAMDGDFRFDPQGSIARKLALLAAGETDLVVSLYPKNEWDICAGIALIESLEGYSSVILTTGEKHLFNQPSLISYGLIAGPEKLCQEFIKYKSEKKIRIYNSYA